MFKAGHRHVRTQLASVNIGWIVGGDWCGVAGGGGAAGRHAAGHVAAGPATARVRPRHRVCRVRGRQEGHRCRLPHRRPCTHRHWQTDRPQSQMRHGKYVCSLSYLNAMFWQLYTAFSLKFSDIVLRYCNSGYFFKLMEQMLHFPANCFQVRTKSRDSQSSDSAPTPIPPAVLRGVVSRMPRQGPGPHQAGPGYRGPQQRPQPYQQHQQVIEHDENLSDKEIFPSNNRHDPHAAQVTTHFFFYVTVSCFTIQLCISLVTIWHKQCFAIHNIHIFIYSF